MAPNRHSKKLASAGNICASFTALTAIWAVVACISNSNTLPSPVAVLDFMVAEAIAGPLFLETGATLLRVGVSLLISMALGSAIGIFLGLRPAADRFFDSWVVLFLNIPAVVVIVLAYVWLGLNEFAALVAIAVNKIPNVVVVMREGARSLDPQYADMANVFRLTIARKIRNVILPQLYPFVAASIRSGFSLIWKIVLVVELLGRPNGVGFQIHLHFQLFDVAGILGYALTFVVVMLGVEFFLLQPAEQHAHRWRTHG